MLPAPRVATPCGVAGHRRFETMDGIIKKCPNCGQRQRTGVKAGHEGIIEMTCKKCKHTWTFGQER